MFILSDNCYISKSQTFLRPMIKAYNLEDTIKSYSLDLTKIEDFGINPKHACLYRAIECSSEDMFLAEEYDHAMDNDLILYYKQLWYASIKYGFIPVNIIKGSSTRIFYYNKNGKTSEFKKDKASVMLRSAYVTCKDAILAAENCTALVGSVGVMAFIYIDDYYANSTKFVCDTIVLKEEENVFSDIIVDISSGFKIWCCDLKTESAHLIQDDANTVFDWLLAFGTLTDQNVYELNLNRCKESKTPSDALATLPTFIQKYKGVVAGDSEIHYLYSFKDEPILIARVWYLEYYSEIEHKYYYKNGPQPYSELTAVLLCHYGFLTEKAAYAASVVYNKECHTEYLTVKPALLYKSKSSDKWNFVG